MGTKLQMGLRTLARRVAVGVARRIGRKARQYAAPLLPVIVTPLALGAGLSAAAAALFLDIADDVREQDGVWRFDHEGLHLALTLRTPSRTALAHSASALARPDVMSAVGLAALAVSWRSPVHRSKGILLAVALSGGGAIIGGIKLRFERERPTLIDALATEKTFSFPSGHAFISLCFYSILASWWIRTRPQIRDRVAIALLSALFILLIGSSRVYLGVHYPSDVLAGYAAAIPWVISCLAAYNSYERKMALLPPGPNRRRITAKPKDDEETTA